MKNKTSPNNADENGEELGTNPFENEELASEHRDVEASHPTDDPGRDYDEVETLTIDEPAREEETERHPSSGVSSPSAPRRPGGGTRQSVAQENEEPVTSANPVVPGELFLQDEPVEINVAAEVTTLRVKIPRTGRSRWLRTSTSPRSTRRCSSIAKPHGANG